MTGTPKLRLTQTVQKGGCAAKVAAAELRSILGHVDFPPSPKELLVGSQSFDDAGVYQMNSEQALVQTLDFFTPIVDTPKLFGKISAANALSDVYAMGGEPLTAMAIFAFPLATLESSVAIDVLQGASDTVSESRAAFVGGHTIDDDTMKFGLSVTGMVHPQKIWTNAKAEPGQALILTKALGTGTLTAALKRGEVDEPGIEDALKSMCLLNNIRSLIDNELASKIYAATDITGFGLAGHAFNLAKASEVSLEVVSSDLPCFEKSLELLSRGFLTKAHRTNAEYTKGHIEFRNEDQVLRELVFDPQTSGGLLLSVDENYAAELINKLSGRFYHATRVGSVKTKAAHDLVFV